MGGYICMAILHLLWFLALAAMVRIAFRDEEPFSEKMLEAIFVLLVAASYTAMATGLI